MAGPAVNRLDALIRDVPLSCHCKWAWRKRLQRWVLTEYRPSCPDDHPEAQP